MLWRTSCQRIFFSCVSVYYLNNTLTQRGSNTLGGVEAALSHGNTHPFLAASLTVLSPRTQSNACTHIHVPDAGSTHTRTVRHALRVNAYTHNQTRTHSQRHAHSQTRTLSRTNTQTQSYTHARTYTYIDEHKLHLFFLLQSHSNKKVMPVLNWFQNIGISKFYNVT